MEIPLQLTSSTKGNVTELRFTYGKHSPSPLCSLVHGPRDPLLVSSPPELPVLTRWFVQLTTRMKIARRLLLLSNASDPDNTLSFYQCRSFRGVPRVLVWGHNRFESPCMPISQENFEKITAQLEKLGVELGAGARA